MLVEYDAGSVNDSHALASMAVAVKELLGNGSMDVLADKGYHTGQELGKLEMETITSYVSPKEPSNPPNDLFPVSRFEYDGEKDEYTCPAGESLSSNNVWHSHSGKGRKPAFRFKRYTTPARKNCCLRERCTAGKRNGRAIDRSEYADAIEANGRRVKKRPEYYRLRQQITEYQFGTLKRQRGFTYTLLKGKEKVLGEVGIMMMAYDLARCAAILKTAGLLRALGKTRSCPKKPCFRADNGSLWTLFYNEKIVTKKYLPEKCARKTEKFNHKKLFLSLEAA